MKIATLQFAPRVGQVAANFSRAEALLMREEREGVLVGIDLLVLPELAFTGYNHPSLAAIAPYLEPTADGPSTRWAIRTAKRLKCTVAVGYPEAATVDEGNFNTIYDATISASTAADTLAYNSLVFINYLGQVVAHYRKSFLYYTDETWAQEGSGFFGGVLPVGAGGRQVKAVAGICMDINNYKFESPWTAYEFANHVLEVRPKVVIVSMAWLTRLTWEEIQDDVMAPDAQTVSYWTERFRPLVEANGPEQEVILVFANRCGEEGVADRIGSVVYAGSSTVMSMKKGAASVRIWDIFGKAQEGVLVTDTAAAPKYAMSMRIPDLTASSSTSTSDSAL